MVAFERDKIKGAVRTDFILSAEIIVITLGSVAQQSLVMKAGVLALIALVMTIGVYGLVAGIVKLDDAGLWLSRRGNALAQRFGGLLLLAAPLLMKLLSVVGTAAMFLVGGGIIVHGWPWLHHRIESLVQLLDGHALSGPLTTMASLTADALSGVAAGAVALIAVTIVKKLLPR
jgi:predicted DNA repair protein MutK